MKQKHNINNNNENNSINKHTNNNITQLTPKTKNITEH